MNTTSLFRLSLATLVLASLACQSAEDHRSAELRESLRKHVTELEPLNAKLIAEYEAFLKERVAMEDEDGIERVRADLLKAQKDLPLELDDFRQRIKGYPNSGLPTLDQELRRIIRSRSMLVKQVVEERADEKGMDRLRNWKLFR